MDEYVALAQRVVLTMGDVQGCLVLSRDGLVLAAFPEEAEPVLKPAWLRFVGMGEIRKSFVEFADQLWGFVHRGPYAAFVIAGVGVRPGILLDQLEQALLTAEEGRTKRDAVKLPDAAAAPSGKPRTSLHPPADKPAPAEVAAAVPLDPAALEAAPPVEMVAPVEAVAAPIDPAVTGFDPAVTGFDPATAALDPATTAVEPVAAAPEPGETPQEPAKDAPKGKGSGLKKKPEKLVSSAADGAEEESAEIDRVLLAKEFSGLLQLGSDGDEGSS